MTNKERPRFFGIYRGVVTSISDPLNRNRIKAVVPQVFGGNQTGWIEACLPVVLQVKPENTSGAKITIDGPEVGKGIWIMFESGDPDYPVWIGVMS